MLLNPLGQTVGFTKSKQLVLKSCSSVHDKNHLFKLGCLLGINEWTNDISSKCSMPENAIHRLPLDLEEIFEEEQVRTFVSFSSFYTYDLFNHV